HDNRGAGNLLQLRRALVMVAMGMADDDILDVLGIEAELGEAVDDLRLGRIGEVGVDDDDALAGGQRPGRELARTEPVEIVEDLEGRRIPGGAIRRRGRSTRATAAPAAAPGAWRGDRAQVDEGVAMLRARRLAGRDEVGVDLALV